jgi:hypothetical protein
VYLDFVNVATGGDVGPTRRTVVTSLAMEETKSDYIKIIGRRETKEKMVHGGRDEWTEDFPERDAQ